MSKNKWWMDTHGNVIARESDHGDVIIDKEYVDSIRKSATPSAPNSTPSVGGIGEGNIFPLSTKILGFIFGIFALIGMLVVIYWILSLFGKYHQDHKIIQQVIEMVGSFLNVKGRWS